MNSYILIRHNEDGTFNSVRSIPTPTFSEAFAYFFIDRSIERQPTCTYMLFCPNTKQTRVICNVLPIVESTWVMS